MQDFKVLTSSVIRGADKGNSHGGVYLVDLQSGNFDQVIDWNTTAIDWSGRGGDRGLRGIAISQNEIYMAGSDELFVFDKNFQLLTSFRHPLLKHCHEIFLNDNLLYLSSTGYNIILTFDLKKKKFVFGYLATIGVKGYWLYRHGFPLKPHLIHFDANIPQDFSLVGRDSLHINNVFLRKNSVFFSGTRIKHVFEVIDGNLNIFAHVPYSGHNARPFREGILMNDTAEKRAVYLDRKGNLLHSYPVKIYPIENLKQTQQPKRVAQQGFARGLAILDDNQFVVGSSPATLNVFKFGQSQPIKTIMISQDLRNAIHGLVLWPF